MANRAVMNALAGAAAVGVALSPALAAPLASADSRPVVGACREATSPELMRDNGEPLNLTVEKTKGNEYSDATIPLGSIEGIEFKLHSVRGLSLTTPSGLDAAKHMTVDDARANGLDLVTSQRTGADGSTQFTGLKPGMYLVEEVAPADTTHDYRTSDPFLVLLPTIEADCENKDLDTVVVVKSHTGAETTPPPPPVTFVTTPPGEPPTTVTTTPRVPGTPETETTAIVTSTEPGTPGSGGSGSPGSPGAPGSGSNDGSQRENRNGPLASTGANVIWALIVAIAFIIGGILLVRNRKDEESA